VPLLLIPLLLVALVLVAIALLPLSLFQRYRVGSARRPARGWFISLNLIAIAISVAIFLAAAAITTAWVANAFSYTLAGLAIGCLLGVVGLALTKWEPATQALHYTPNRWLVLFVTLLVTARVAYGFWRSWHTWSAGLQSWSAAFGVAESMGAGAVVLGYYLAYWLGVRRRLKSFRVLRWTSQQRTLRRTDVEDQR
jgi:hypothetical protein